MNRERWGVAVVAVILGLICCSGLAAAESATWKTAQGTFQMKATDEDRSGVLLLRPLDDWCALFELSVSENGADDTISKLQLLTGVFIIDEMGYGTWQSSDQSQKLEFTLFRHHVIVKASGDFPLELGGAYKKTSDTFGCSVPMIQAYLEFIPHGKTGLRPGVAYEYRNTNSYGIGQYNKISVTDPEGNEQRFWLTPDLRAVYRVEDGQGVLIYELSQ